MPFSSAARIVAASLRACFHGRLPHVVSNADLNAQIGAAKAAIVMFTRTIAIEEKRYGIRANALTPSLVYGTASTERITSDGFSAKLFAAAAKQAHLGVPTADDIAALAVFLCSPAAARLTGSISDSATNGLVR